MSQKKLLAILGSPHLNGTTASMLECAIQASEKAGYDVTKINLYEKQICFCTGCRTCIRTGTCNQKDDIQEINGVQHTFSFFLDMRSKQRGVTQHE